MRGQSSLSSIGEKPNALCDANNAIPMGTRHLNATCAAEGITHNTGAHEKRQWGCRTPLMNADDGSSIHSTTSHHYAQAAHRTADAPPDLSNCPTQSSGRAMELIRQRRSTVVRRITDIPALGQLYEERERGRSRDVGGVDVGAENVPSRAIHDFLLHARTADERGELRGLFDGNRSGAIDPTAVRQDAAVHVGNESKPAGHDDSGVTKNCGAIGDEAGAPLDKGRDESSYPQPDRLEERVVFRLAWITASRWSEIASLTPTISHWSRTGP
ncbi:hypothetical protein TcYC6_0058970 [Trypanosoma cruzi]|nr:hypothetical protein TcYC6_0058970 [Trypanosoma cruzi]